jgi:hypothetical protein
MLQPKSQRHLYEIHTVPQSDVVGAILSTEHVVELARLSSENSGTQRRGVVVSEPQHYSCFFQGTDGFDLRSSPVSLLSGISRFGGFH